MQTLPPLQPSKAPPTKFQRASALLLIQFGLLLYTLSCLALGLFSYFSEEYLTGTSSPLGSWSARVLFLFASVNFALMFSAIFLPRVAGGLGVIAFVGWSIWFVVDMVLSADQVNVPGIQDVLNILLVFVIAATPALLVGLGVSLHGQQR